MPQENARYTHGFDADGRMVYRCDGMTMEPVDVCRTLNETARLQAHVELLECALIELFDIAIPQAQPWKNSPEEKAEYSAKVLPEQLRALLRGHESVNHRAGEYARGPVSTNSIESVWAVLKRGLHGVYHHASPKHLFRYVDEFTWWLNDGDVKRHTLERLASFVDAIVGKRLTYKRLIAEVPA